MSAHEVSNDEQQRTLQQNKALHVGFRMLAETLNAAGYDMKAVLKEEVEIPWTPEMVKEHLWRPIQQIMLDKESTTEANTTDYSAVWDVLSRHLSQKLGITPPPFPDRFSMGRLE
jgi:hypothetical protein